METDFVSIDQLGKLYPDESILLGNPKMYNTTVLGGTVLYPGYLDFISKVKKHELDFLAEACSIPLDEIKETANLLSIKVRLLFVGR